MDWAAEITACWRASVESIFQVGRLLIAAKEALPHGQFGEMIEDDLPFTASTAQRLMVIAADARLSNPAHVQLLPPSWGTLYELTKLPDEEFETRINNGTICPEMRRRDVARAGKAHHADVEGGGGIVEAISPSPVIIRLPDDVWPEDICDNKAPLPTGSRAIMASRQEPDDSLDYFPTPPFATRALCEVILPRYAIARSSSAWEPACGEGHIAEVLNEYFREVVATDIHDYGYGNVADFLNSDAYCFPDWIITNPPFNDKAEAFVLRAINAARLGVAMFLRLQWLETVGRYDRVFKPYPPALIAQFAERVPLCKGRWDPDGSTATAYLWIVWHHCHVGPTEFCWIPPGQRERLTRPDDRERFTSRPVLRRTAEELAALPSISEPAGSKPLIRRGEREPESDPGFSAGSLMDGSQPSGECNDQDSIGRRSEGHDNRILRNGHIPARVPERVRSPNNPAEQVEGREDDRPGDVRSRTGDAGEGGQAESGQADRRTTERTETCGYPVPIADPWAELDIPKFLRRVPESQSSSPAAPVETAADLAADGSCLTESSAAFSQESQTGAAFIAPIPVAAPAAAAESGVGSAAVSKEGEE